MWFTINIYIIVSAKMWAPGNKKRILQLIILLVHRFFFNSRWWKEFLRNFQYVIIDYTKIQATRDKNKLPYLVYLWSIYQFQWKNFVFASLRSGFQKLQSKTKWISTGLLLINKTFTLNQTVPRPRKFPCEVFGIMPLCTLNYTRDFMKLHLNSFFRW